VEECWMGSFEFVSAVLEQTFAFINLSFQKKNVTSETFEYIRLIFQTRMNIH